MTVAIRVSRQRVSIPFTYKVERVDLKGRAMPTVTDVHGMYQQVQTLGTDVRVEASPVCAEPSTEGNKLTAAALS